MKKMTHHLQHHAIGLLALLAAGFLLTACGGGEGDKDETDAMDAPDTEVSLLCGADPCADGELCCDFNCIEPATDADNCGACGFACAEGQTCEGGLCTCGSVTCGTGQTCCVEPTLSCRDLSADQEHCGVCGNECAPNEICLEGKCGCQTADGSYEACGTDETCCPGLGCRDLDFDPRSCGTCGATCGAGELCVQGECACGDVTAQGAPACALDEACCGSPASCRSANDPECSCGTALCGAGQSCCEVNDGMNTADVCISTWREPQHCGGCGSLCGAAESCVGGDCLCQGGVADCNMDTSDGCEVRLDIDPANCGSCGNTCASGEVCDGQGQCSLRCQLGLTECNGRCVDLNWDRENCGICGNECSPGEVANGAGECAVSCLVGFTDCDGECVNINANRANCGTCGVVCAPGEVCDGAGQCGLTCIPGLTDCAGNCVDLNSDRAHCGTCGVACASGEVCNNGQCQNSCLAGATDCGGNCVDLDSSRFHCGACGNACQSGEQCIDGTCNVVCAALPGIQACGGRCVDVNTNRAHCGACGEACQNSERCEAGECVDNCLSGFEVCAGNCVDVLTSEAHCGTCGSACDASEVCTNGACCDAQDGCGQPQQLVLGVGFGCALSQDGAVYCWGWNDSGRIGDGTTDNRASATQVVGLDGTTSATTAVEIGAGRQHACALLADQRVVCWGDNSGGRLGDGTETDSSVPVEVTPSWGSTVVLSLTVGRDHACVLTEDGGGYCWGDGGAALGDGGGAGSLTPVRVQGLLGALDLVASTGTTCALVGGAQPARVLCWGNNSGCTDCNGLAAPDGSNAVEQQSDGTEITDFEALWNAGNRPCGRRSDGTTWCWTSNPAQQQAEVSPTTGTEFTTYRSGGVECGLSSDGVLACWGYQNTGELGHSCGYVFDDSCESSVNEPRPVLDANGNPIRAVDFALGSEHGCAVLVSGQVACWGRNTSGQLGVGTMLEPGPTQVELSSAATGIEASIYGICALLPAEGVSCWGYFSNPADEGAAVPTVKPGTMGATEVAAGDLGVCFIDGNGAVFCWADSGFVGDGCDPFAMAGAPDECEAASAPQPVVGIDGTQASAVSLAAALSHFCVALADGSVQCWGWNDELQLGQDSMTTFSTAPVTVPGLSDVVEVTAGWNYTCARTSTGSVQCWGWNNSNQLGVGGFTPSTEIPQQVVGIDGMNQSATSIHGGYQTVMAQLDDGSVWGWGNNADVTLGYADGAFQAESPIEVVNAAAGVTAYSLETHSCFVDGQGAVYCLGTNDGGRLGSDVGAAYSLEVVPEFDGSSSVLGIATDVATSFENTCVLTAAGEVWCWGQEGAVLGTSDFYSPWAVSWSLP